MSLCDINRASAKVANFLLYPTPRRCRAKGIDFPGLTRTSQARDLSLLLFRSGIIAAAKVKWMSRKRVAVAAKRGRGTRNNSSVVCEFWSRFLWPEGKQSVHHYLVGKVANCFTSPVAPRTGTVFTCAVMENFLAESQMVTVTKVRHDDDGLLCKSEIDPPPNGRPQRLFSPVRQSKYLKV